MYTLNETKTEIKEFDENLFKEILNLLSKQPVEKHEEIVEHYEPVSLMVGGTRLRPYLSIQNFEEQLNLRHKLLATSLYELVKYDRPMSYLGYRRDTISHGEKPTFQRLYSKYTYDYRDIVLRYYPRDYHGFALLLQTLKRTSKRPEAFWDKGEPVYEWANVPPLDTNNVPRNIPLARFN